jgi:hypothetical protein
VSLLWVFAALALLGVLPSLIQWSQRRAHQPDLGFVSDQWLAEQRLAQTQDPQR